MGNVHRIFFHDYGRYAFTLDLARELARRGHQVQYSFSALDTVRADAEAAGEPNLALVPIQAGEGASKSSFVKRFQLEIAYGVKAAEKISEFKPSIVLSGNTPLESQWRMMKASRTAGSAFVYWMQDVLSLAARKILKPKFGLAGAMVADHFERIERRMVSMSDAVIAIAPAFHEILREWGVAEDHITVIENWAPALAVPSEERISKWKGEQGLGDRQIVLYSGTLGLKHKPELVLELAKNWRERTDVKIVIIAEGAGIDWLREKTANEPLPNLLLLPFQPFSLLPVTMSAANVLMVLLDEEAVGYCVPSKTLTYMTAGRPILGAMPAANLAAELVETNRMGLVADPSNTSDFVRKATQLIDRPDEAVEMGHNARAYAEGTFDIRRIGDAFEGVLLAVADSRSKSSG